MESPIRYALNRGTISFDASLIEPLGPFAFAMKSIVFTSNNEREDVLSGKFVCWASAQYTES